MQQPKLVNKSDIRHLSNAVYPTPSRESRCSSNYRYLRPCKSCILYDYKYKIEYCNLSQIKTLFDYAGSAYSISIYCTVYFTFDSIFRKGFRVFFKVILTLWVTYTHCFKCSSSSINEPSYFIFSLWRCSFTHSKKYSRIRSNIIPL